MGRFLLCCLLLAAPAAAQLDSSALRAKFGTPLNRETFHMPAGFDLVVDYGINAQVCKLQVPALMPTKAKVSNITEMRQRMREFLWDVVPASIRGKEAGSHAMAMGTLSIIVNEYEHVTVSETASANESSDTITVTFKGGYCAAPAVQ